MSVCFHDTSSVDYLGSHKFHYFHNIFFFILLPFFPFRQTSEFKCTTGFLPFSFMYTTFILKEIKWTKIKPLWCPVLFCWFVRINENVHIVFQQRWRDESWIVYFGLTLKKKSNEVNSFGFYFQDSVLKEMKIR